MRIQIVDDSRSFLVGAKQALEAKIGLGEGQFEVQTFLRPEDWLLQAKNHSNSEAPHLYLFDISMHGDDEAGLTLAMQARALFPEAVIVMFSQYDDADSILRFIEVGADSFISKKTPLSDLPKELLQAYTVSLRKRPGSFDPYEHLLKGLCAGDSLKELASRIPRIIQSAVRSVHVYGETGTGKEVVADLFERFVCDQKQGTPFVRVNCGALSSTLLESELFGHKKGSFTGALSDKIGLLEAAHGGWVFLDEVATLSASAQTALLRVVENQEVMRLGETKPRKISVRVISACNEDLKKKVEAGDFRRDFWQRLTELSLELLPLRQRTQEIPELVGFFVSKMGAEPYEVSSAALEILKRHDWSEGNVRELRNCLRAMTEFSSSNFLGPNSIPRRVYESILEKRNKLSEAGVAAPSGAERAPKKELLQKSQPLSGSLGEGSSNIETQTQVQDPSAGAGASAGASAFFPLTVAQSILGAGIAFCDAEKQIFECFVVEFVESKSPKVSLRDLEEVTGLSRMTVSRRIKEILAGEGQVQVSQQALSKLKAFFGK